MRPLTRIIMIVSFVILFGTACQVTPEQVITTVEVQQPSATSEILVVTATATYTPSPTVTHTPTATNTPRPPLPRLVDVTEELANDAIFQAYFDRLPEEIPGWGGELLPEDALRYENAQWFIDVSEAGAHHDGPITDIQFDTEVVALTGIQNAGTENERKLWFIPRIGESRDLDYQDGWCKGGSTIVSAEGEASYPNGWPVEEDTEIVTVTTVEYDPRQGTGVKFTILQSVGFTTGDTGDDTFGFTEGMLSSQELQNIVLGTFLDQWTDREREQLEGRHIVIVLAASDLGTTTSFQGVRPLVDGQFGARVDQYRGARTLHVVESIYQGTVEYWTSSTILIAVCDALIKELTGRISFARACQIQVAIESALFFIVNQTNTSEDPILDDIVWLFVASVND